MAWNVQPELIGSGLAGHGLQYTAELWDGYDPQAMDRNAGWGHYDEVNFISDVPVAATNLSVRDAGNWNIFTGLTTTTIGPTAIQGGAVALNGTTDNHDAYLQRGVIGSRPYALVTSTETAAWPYHHLARVRFECRLAFSTVAANVLGSFWGLAGVIAANDLDNDTADVVTSKNFFGWSVLNGASAENATPRFIYQAAADAAPTVLIANVGTIAANTWYNFGFDYNPMAPDANRGTIYFNSVKSSTYLTAGQAAAATFPKTVDGSTMVNLAPSWMIKPGATSAGSMYMSGFRICQEYLTQQGNEAAA